MARTANEAIEALARSILDEVEVWPVRTNAGFLFNAVLSDGFGSADLNTNFIGEHFDELLPESEPDDALWRGAAAVALAEDADGDNACRIPSQRADFARSVALGWGGDFRIGRHPGDGPMAAVSGFRDDERVVVFYEGQALRVRANFARLRRRFALTTATSSRRCRAR